MMRDSGKQLGLFPLEHAPADIASPLCCYERPCPRKGRAVLGPERDLRGCVNQSITCLTCGATGERSTRKDLS